MQSLLGQSCFIFWFTAFLYQVSIQGGGGHKNKIPKTDESVKINLDKRFFYFSQYPVFCLSEESSRNLWHMSESAYLFGCLGLCNGRYH